MLWVWNGATSSAALNYSTQFSFVDFTLDNLSSSNYYSSLTTEENHVSKTTGQRAMNCSKLIALASLLQPHSVRAGITYWGTEQVWVSCVFCCLTSIGSHGERQDCTNTGLAEAFMKLELTSDTWFLIQYYKVRIHAQRSLVTIIWLMAKCIRQRGIQENNFLLLETIFIFSRQYFQYLCLCRNKSYHLVLLNLGVKSISQTAAAKQMSHPQRPQAPQSCTALERTQPSDRAGLCNVYALL